MRVCEELRERCHVNNYKRNICTTINIEEEYSKENMISSPLLFLSFVHIVCSSCDFDTSSCESWTTPKASDGCLGVQKTPVSRAHSSKCPSPSINEELDFIPGTYSDNCRKDDEIQIVCS